MYLIKQGRVSIFRKKKRNFHNSIKPRKKATRIKSGKHKDAYYLADREYYRKVYLKTDHWRDLKQKKFNLINFCEECKNTKYLDVHHLVYRNLYDVELEDLVVLCRKCHHEEHKQSEKKSDEYKKICKAERYKIRQENLQFKAAQTYKVM